MTVLVGLGSSRPNDDAGRHGRECQPRHERNPYACGAQPAHRHLIIGSKDDVGLEAGRE